MGLCQNGNKVIKKIMKCGFDWMHLNLSLLGSTPVIAWWLFVYSNKKVSQILCPWRHILGDPAIYYRRKWRMTDYMVDKQELCMWSETPDVFKKLRRRASPATQSAEQFLCKFRQKIKWIGLENCRINNMRLKCLLCCTYLWSEFSWQLILWLNY